MDSHRPSRDETILTSVAESIGATLGTIAAKAGSVQKQLTGKVTRAKRTARRATTTATKRGPKRSKRPTKAKASATTARAKRAKRNRKTA